MAESLPGADQGLPGMSARNNSFCMKRVAAVTRKEWQELIFSPVAYIVIAIYLVISGIFFFFISNFFLYNQVDLKLYFLVSPYILGFSISALSMRTFAEEYRSGTIEILKTLPISVLEIVLGKFLALWSFLGLIILFSLGYPISISALGDLDWGGVIAGYIGQILLMGAYTAIGVYASSVSKNSVMSFFIAFLITFLLSFLEFTLRSVPGEISRFLRLLSSSYHVQNMSNGVIDSRDVLYFLSVMFLGIYASWLRVKSKD